MLLRSLLLNTEAYLQLRTAIDFWSWQEFGGPRQLNARGSGPKIRRPSGPTTSLTPPPTALHFHLYLNRDVATAMK